MRTHHSTRALFKSFQVRNAIPQQPLPFPNLDRLIVERVEQIQNDKRDRDRRCAFQKGEHLVTGERPRDRDAAQNIWTRVPPGRRCNGSRRPPPAQAPASASRVVSASSVGQIARGPTTSSQFPILGSMFVFIPTGYPARLRKKIPCRGRSRGLMGLRGLACWGNYCWGWSRHPAHIYFHHQ